jgi:SAM-dependent methyltransferase
VNDRPDAAMAAEFDTVARWTADAVGALGPEYAIPAGCRGSGGPEALDWLLTRLGLSDGMRILDVGAGVGGPAAYGSRALGGTWLLAEAELGACRAARRLFALPTVRADAAALPITSGQFDAAWSLGVLCTLSAQQQAVDELRRVVRPGGYIGLLVYARHGAVPDQPEGNEFPTPHELAAMTKRAGLRTVDAAGLEQLPVPHAEWEERAAAVREEVATRHHEHPAWLAAREQEATMAELLAAGAVGGLLTVLEVPGGRA